MTKKWIVAAMLVVALALAVTPLAAAAGKGSGHKVAKGKSKFNLVGTVSAIAADGSTLTAKVKAGTKTVRTFRGADLTLAVDPAAKIRLVTEEGCIAVTLADIPVGVKVKIRGFIDRTDPENVKFIATLVKAKAPAVVPVPEPTLDPTPEPSPAE